VGGWNASAGYDIESGGGRLLVNETEAGQIREIFQLFRTMLRFLPYWPKFANGVGSISLGSLNAESSILDAHSISVTAAVAY